MGFVKVSAQQARESRHYGFDGWLVVFYVLAALSAASAAVNAIIGLVLADVVQFGAWPWLAAAKMVLWLPFLILAPIRHRLMPAATILCAWVSVVFTGLALPGLWNAMLTGMTRQMLAMVPKGTDTRDAAQALEQLSDAAQHMVEIMTWAGVGFAVVTAALFTWYLVASRRVNATYRHRLPAEDMAPPTAGMREG